MEQRLAPRNKPTPPSNKSVPGPLAVRPDRPRRAYPRERSPFRCSHCGESRTLKAFPTVYGNGSSISRYRRGLVLKTGWAEMRRQSVLAEKCSPPKPMRYFWRVALLLAGLAGMLVDRKAHELFPGMFDVSSAGMLLALAGAFLVLDAMRWNRRKYPLRMEDWRNSFFCTRCSHVTLIERVDN